MKKLVNLKVLVLIIILSNSCQKENIYTNYDSKIENRDDKSKSANYFNDEIGVELFAKALSNAIYYEKEFCNFIYQSSGYSDKDNKNNRKNKFNNELILSCIKSVSITPDLTFEQIINKYLTRLNNNYNLEKILLVQPNLIIKIPDKFLNLNWDPNIIEQRPFIKVPNSAEDFYYYNENKYLSHELNTTDQYQIFYCIVRNSSKNLLVKLDDYKVYGQELSLLDLFGNLNKDCIQNYINKQNNSCVLSGYKFINIIELCSAINLCNEGPQEPTDGNNTNDVVKFCEWNAHREVEWSHQRNDSKWIGLKLASISTFNFLDNCSDIVDEFGFSFNWVSATKGSLQQYERKVILHRNDLLDPEKWAMDYIYQDYCHCWKYMAYKIKDATVEWVTFPQKIRFFGNTEKVNNWTLDNQGEYFMLGITKFNAVNCSSNNSSTNSTSITESFNLNVGIYDVVSVTGGYNYSQSNTVSGTVSYSVSGFQLISMDKSPVYFCEQESEIQDFETGGMLALRVEDTTWEK